jgi:putative membrane protein
MKEIFMIRKNYRSAIVASFLAGPFSLGIIGTVAHGSSFEVDNLEASFTDGEIAGVINAFNQQIVDAGNLAAKSARNIKLVDYAKSMVTEHQTITAEFNGVLNAASIKAQDSSTRAGILADGLRDMATLKLLSGESFDKQYLHQQIKFEEHLIELLDTGLMTSATNPELKNYLTGLRTKAATFLANAQALEPEVGIL